MRYIVLTLAVSACVPAPVPPPQPPDASDAAPSPSTPCEAACAALRAVGCHDGEVASCVTVMAHLNGSQKVRTASGKPLTCAAMAAVHTITEARAQGAFCDP